MLCRMWVNQPSDKQRHWALHGAKVLAEDNGAEFIRVWFTAGTVESQMIARNALSKGWR